MKHFAAGKLTWSPLLKFVKIQLECYSIYVMIIVCDHVEMKKIGRTSEMISKKKQTRVILKIIENNLQTVVVDFMEIGFVHAEVCFVYSSCASRHFCLLFPKLNLVFITRSGNMHV